MPHKSQRSPDVIKQQQSDTDVWSLPDVADEHKHESEKTNAFGRRADWRFEPPEEEIPEPEPLTATQIEEIRQAAFEEGFNQGKEEGFEKGYDEGKAQGQEEGKALGHQEGLTTGLEEGKANIDELSQHWKELIDQLHAPMKVIEKDVEAQLLHLVVSLTQAVTLHEARTNPDILSSAIATGIKALPEQEPQTQILVHPDDIKRVEQQFGQDYIQKQGWRIFAAPQLEPGSCQIENSTSNIDLSIKSRLKEVLDSFLQDSLHQ